MPSKAEEEHGGVDSVCGVADQEQDWVDHDVSTCERSPVPQSLPQADVATGAQASAQGVAEVHVDPISKTQSEHEQSDDNPKESDFQAATVQAYQTQDIQGAIVDSPVPLDELCHNSSGYFVDNSTGSQQAGQPYLRHELFRDSRNPISVDFLHEHVLV